MCIRDSPCIYSLGLGVIAQGGKQVLLQEAVINYRAGQGMLTSIDQPVVARVTQGSAAEPFLGMMLTLDMHQILQTAAQMQLFDQGRLQVAVQAFPLSDAPQALEKSRGRHGHGRLVLDMAR